MPKSPKLGFINNILMAFLSGFLLLSMVSCGVYSNQQLNTALTKGKSPYAYVNRGNANSLVIPGERDYITARYHENWRVIHQAAALNDRRLVDLLIQNGADLTAVTKKKNSYTLKPSGYTPAEIASVHGYGGLARYMAGYTGENITQFEREEKHREVAHRARAAENKEKWGNLLEGMIDVFSNRNSSSGHADLCSCGRPATVNGHCIACARISLGSGN